MKFKKDIQFSKINVKHRKYIFVSRLSTNNQKKSKYTKTFMSILKK